VGSIAIEKRSRTDREQDRKMTEALQAQTITLAGHSGDEIEAYLAQPLGEGPYGGVVVIHHMPGWDSATKEITRKFAAMGYLAVCPNLHYRDAPGAAPDDAAAASRAKGGVPDERLVGDLEAAVDALKAIDSSNGKVATIGYCSGGRQSFLAACSLPLDAAVVCYGAFIVGTPPEGMPLKVTPLLDRVPDLSCPLLGLFGAEDSHPSPEQVAELAEALRAAGKTFDFHVFDDAGHAFFSTDRPSYRVAAAMEGWKKIWDFFGRHLAS
jgi:carboxymethylenebutenolidase